jgi:hypothetical protein
LKNAASTVSWRSPKYLSSNVRGRAYIGCTKKRWAFAHLFWLNDIGDG